MRTAGVLAVTGVLLFIGAVAACSSDEPAGSAPVPEAGVGPEESGTTDASEGGTSAPGTPKRGTRLAPRFRETADGLSDFERMVDTGLGDIECTPGRAADGVVRCMPYESAGLYGQAYADSDCMIELAPYAGTCKKLAFATKNTEPGSCKTPNDVFDLGAEHTGQIYLKQNPTTCVPTVASPTQKYFAIGAKRAPTDFVKLTQRTETIAGGVGASMMDGEDGSSAPQYMLVDVMRGRGCIEGKAADLETRCVPSYSGYTGNAFTDNTCTKEAAQIPPGDCGDALTVSDTATSNTPNNDGTVRIFSLGAKLPTQDFFRKNDQQTCEGPLTGSDDVYERGPEIRGIL